MDKRRDVVWSSNAKVELFEILDFYDKRNGSRNYSIKVYRGIQITINLLKRFPRLGIRTSNKNIRVVFEGDFSVFYEYLDDNIIIHSVWDNQRDPKQSKFEK